MQISHNRMETGLSERLKTSPVNFSRTIRPDVVRTVTSGNAGYAQPLCFIPLLREDGLETTRVQLRAYMEETTNLLLNTVSAVFTAYMVPKLALNRFDESLDALNRSYMGQPEKDGSTISWIAQRSWNRNNPNPILKAAGLHGRRDQSFVNADYEESYNKVFEYRMRQRSEALYESVKNRYNYQLAPAFFDNSQMAMVKNSFDDQMLDGAVPLAFIGSGEAPLQFIGGDGFEPSVNDDQSQPDGRNGKFNSRHHLASSDQLRVGDKNGKPYAFADVAEAMEDLSLSIANIDLAREMSAWAAVRAQYQGLKDDDIIDLLMAGVRIPTQHMARPLLLARQKVSFGMTQRFSSEAEKLDISATRGVAGTEMTLRCPPVNTGGVIVVQVEVVPEQFWERSADYHLLADTSTRRPDRLLDQLDPQAVEIVENYHADVSHDDPTGIFGYAPLNHGYVRQRYNMGGKFYKNDPKEAWREDRNRIWASEPINPRLSEEFFLTTDLNSEIFMFSEQDNFEFSLAGDFRVSGLTHIGPRLREQTGQYDAISERIDKRRISGDPVDSLVDSENDESETLPSQEEVTETVEEVVTSETPSNESEPE